MREVRVVAVTRIHPFDQLYTRKPPGQVGAERGGLQSPMSEGCRAEIALGESAADRSMRAPSGVRPRVNPPQVDSIPATSAPRAARIALACPQQRTPPSYHLFGYRPSPA